MLAWKQFHIQTNAAMYAIESYCERSLCPGILKLCTACHRHLTITVQTGQPLDGRTAVTHLLWL